MSTLVAAELLKLLRRRSTLGCALGLTVGLVVLLCAWSPGGGANGLRNTGFALAYFGAIAGILLGCAAGAGDHAAGVLRDLVATGRSRIELFAARVPALLAVVVGLALASGILAGALSAAFSAAGTAPPVGLVAQVTLWETASITFAALLTLGVSALVGNPAIAVGAVVGFHLLASFFLVDVVALGGLRELLPLAAIGRLDPAPEALFGGTAPAGAVAVLLAWVAAALVAGTWRTVTQEL